MVKVRRLANVHRRVCVAAAAFNFAAQARRIRRRHDRIDGYDDPRLAD
jgi:hypothetical protein